MGTTRTFAESQEHCQSWGGYLSTIGTDTERNFVNGVHVVNSGASTYWIGYNDAEMHTHFRWVTGEVLLSPNMAVYNNWASAQPVTSIDGSPRCTAVTNGDATWTTSACTVQKAHVCERDY